MGMGVNFCVHKVGMGLTFTKVSLFSTRCFRNHFITTMRIHC